MKRTAQVRRVTGETNIEITIGLDGKGFYENDTGVGFLNHMLDLFARHGRFDLKVRCVGDTCVDDHHSVEDVGIALGMAMAQALGDRRGIVRAVDAEPDYTHRPEPAQTVEVLERLAREADAAAG